MKQLSEKAKLFKKEYHKNWRLKNAEKRKEYDISYWERKAAEGYTIEKKITDLRAKGMSQRQIAKELNISLGTVNNRLNIREQT